MLKREFYRAVGGGFAYFRYLGINPYRIGRFVLGRLKDWILAIGPGPIRRLRRWNKALSLAYVTRKIFSPSMRVHIRRETFLEEQDWSEEFRV